MQISYKKFLNLAEKVYQQIDKTKKYKGIICPLNGGLYLSDYLSKKLNLPIYCIDIKSYNERNEQERCKVTNFMPITNPGNYIIADDILDSGDTIKYIKDFYNFQGRWKFDVVVLVTNTIKENLIYGICNKKRDWVVFPWEKI